MQGGHLLKKCAQSLTVKSCTHPTQHFLFSKRRGVNDAVLLVPSSAKALRILPVWSNCMTSVINAITELSAKLTCNDRLGSGGRGRGGGGPHNAMCVCVMMRGFISSPQQSAICWRRGSVPRDRRDVHEYRVHA